MKKFLTFLASLTLIATTVPTVVACSKTDDLPGQYMELTDGNYDKNRNLVLDKNQMTNLLFFQAIDYIKTHPDFRNSYEDDNPNNPDNKIIQALPWFNDARFNHDDYAANIRFNMIATNQAKIMLVEKKLFPTEEIGIVMSKGNHVLALIYGMDDMKPIMINQEKLEKISQPYDKENIRRLMVCAFKNGCSKDEKEK